MIPKRISSFQECQKTCARFCLFLILPLGGEESVEVRAAGVAWCVLRGEHIGQDVVALIAGFVLTHQLGLKEGGPPSLQSLHPSHIRLREKETSGGNIIRANNGKINPSIKTLGYLADSCHPGDLDFGVELVFFGYLSEEEVDFVVIASRVVVCRLFYEG